MAKTRSKDGTAYDINKIIEERNKLLVSQKDLIRLKYLISILDFFYFGIVQ